MTSVRIEKWLWDNAEGQGLPIKVALVTGLSFILLNSIKIYLRFHSFVPDS